MFLLWNFERGSYDYKKAGLLSDVPIPLESRVFIQKENDEKKVKGSLDLGSHLVIVFPNTMESHESIELASGDLGFFRGQIHFSFALFKVF